MMGDRYDIIVKMMSQWVRDMSGGMILSLSNDEEGYIVLPVNVLAINRMKGCHHQDDKEGIVGQHLLKGFQLEFDVCLLIFFITLNELVYMQTKPGFNEKRSKKHAC